MKRFTRYSKRIERNILSVYLRANDQDRAEGLLWYHNAHESARIMGERHKVSIEAACGVIAALSPGLNWGLNLIQSEELIQAWVSNPDRQSLPVLGTYGRRNVIKAARILEGESPLDVLPSTGPKVRSFYQNILNPKADVVVTLDRHAKSLALMAEPTRTGFASSDKSGLVTISEYPYYVRQYKVLADRLGLVPNQLQAICWITWRRLKGNIEQLDLVPF